MAFLTVQFFSEVLDMESSMSVILPDNGFISGRGKKTGIPISYPVLYLLHGRTGDHSSWTRRTSIERYVSDMNIIVVMPGAHNSYYADMEYGPDYFKFLTEELPWLVASFFHVQPEREKTYICGLSMGGYGAFKAALRYPEKYAAAGSLSGSLDLASRIRMGIENEERGLMKMFAACFGRDMNMEGSGNDLFILAQDALHKKRKLPALYQCCGVDDFLYEGNRRFRDFCMDHSIGLTYEESPGEHTWEYWDGAIQSFLSWLPSVKRAP